MQMNPNWRKELPPCTEHQRCQQASAQTCGESGACQRRRDVARYSRATKKPSCFWTTCTRNKLFLTSQSGDAEIPRADVWRTELLCLVASLLPPPPLPPTVNFSISHICPDPHWAPVTAPQCWISWDLHAFATLWEDGGNIFRPDVSIKNKREICRNQISAPSNPTILHLIHLIYGSSFMLHYIWNDDGLVHESGSIKFCKVLIICRVCVCV